MIRTCIINFSGTNTLRETYQWIELATGRTPEVVEDVQSGTVDLPKGMNLYVLPGGFSYGDYLRPGAIAARANIIDQLKEYRLRHKCKVLGICNGFQILIEAGMLPGALLPNKNGDFICEAVSCENGLWSGTLEIAHHSGRYHIDPESTPNELIRYTPAHNHNGSDLDLAGIVSDDGLVLGMMPHPERSFLNHHRATGGMSFFKNFFS